MAVQNCDKKYRLAATSCVWPETAAENCRRLARTVSEVGLYLLEGAACLAYGPADLPQETHGLRYHAHLPVDLPWPDGGRAAFDIVAGLLAKVAHLSPWGFVLHPPADRTALTVFVTAWRAAGHDPADLLLENIEAASPADVLELAQGLGCSVCLDLGHMLAMGHPLPGDEAGLAAAVRMLHVYAPYGEEGPPPGRNHVHRPLQQLAPEGRDLLGRMLARLAPETIVLEVFAPMHLVESLAVFAALADTLGDGA